MKKNSPSVVVLVVLIVIASVLGVGLVFLLNNKNNEVLVPQTEVFRSEGFAQDLHFFSGQLVVLASDNSLNFYDIDSQQLTPYSFPPKLFDTIHHFSFSPSRDKAFVVGSNTEDGVSVVRYALIDIPNYKLTWFDEKLMTSTIGDGYRIGDITMDSGGSKFLFSIIPRVQQDTPVQQYRLIVVDPHTQAIQELPALSGKNISLQYYDSSRNTIAYNYDTADGEAAAIVQLSSMNTQPIRPIVSLSTFVNDVVFGSYSDGDDLVFSSINSPEDVRLRLRPDAGYPLLSPSVERSEIGTYTAYHLWKPGTREGLVRITDTEQNVLVEQKVNGSVEMFFSRDEKRLLIVAEQADKQGMTKRTSSIVDVPAGVVSPTTLPSTVSSIIEWY